MDNATTNLCDTANYLAHNTQLRVMLTLKVVVAAVGLCLFGVLFKVQGTHLAFHSNARLLLSSHHIWVMLQAIANLLCNSFSLIRFAMNFSGPCDYVVSIAASLFLKGPIVYTVYGQVWALAAMAVERCYATYKYQDYEKRDNRVGILLIVFQWLIVIIWIYISSSGLDLLEMKAYPAVTTSKTSGTISTLLLILAGVEVSAISVFLGLLLYNRRKRTHLGFAPLTEKYQISENIRATQLMLPMVFTHFCCFMPTLIAIPFYTIFIDATVDQRHYTVYSETVNSSAFYCVLLPMVLFWRHKVLRDNLQKVLRMNEISPDAPPDQQQVRHFQLLKESWNGPSA